MGYSPEHYLANKEHYAAKSKAWREANKERARINRKRHYEENKQATLDQCRSYHLLTRFKLTTEDYNAKLEAQGGVCAICSQKCTRALAVDHDHTTGKVRGLLCNNCNRGLGHFKDSQVLLGNAREYLLEHSYKEVNCGV